MTKQRKSELKRQMAECLAYAPEVRKVVVFGSFLTTDSPNDMDVAVFVDHLEPYLPLALKYRRMARAVSDQIPLDIVPIRPNAFGIFLDEVNHGEVIFER
jgi:predicted nucleotidyltransferase